MEIKYIEPSEDCMNNPVPGYWRCLLECSDGRIVQGSGPSQDCAIIRATCQKQDHENFLALPDTERLKVLLDGDLLSTDAKEAIKIIGKLVLNLCDRFGSEPR
jgi:hypothetical protein